MDEDRVSLDGLSGELSKSVRGAKLTTANSASEAFDAVAEFDRLDCLITAALMAPQDGFHLAAALRARFPGLRVAYLSKMDLTRHFGKVGSDIVFYKPVNVDALAAWLEDDTVVPSVPPESDASPSTQDVSRERGGREGAQIGDYELLRLLNSTERIETYEAFQRSVDRRVAFSLLRDDVRESDSQAVDEFLDEVRAKASVVHQHIVPVYEAHEEDGVLFYTHELVVGRGLGELLSNGAEMSPAVFVSLVQVVAECFEYLNEQESRFAVLRPEHIFIGADEQARLVNMAVAGGEADESSQVEQIQRFAVMVEPLAEGAESGRAGGVAGLLDSMGGKNAEVMGSWANLGVAARKVAAEIGKESVPELPGLERRAKVAALKKRFVRAALLVGSLIVLGLAVRGVTAILAYLGRPEAKDFNEMIRIPAGRFYYQDRAEPVEMEAYWIDEYEVTIAQYAEFLSGLDSKPSELKRFDHAEQPAGKVGHEPPEWGRYHAAAQLGGFFKGQPVDLNCPVTLVDWWDAYAYAAWKGRRLPTEQEWEKAARGRSGAVYPWGDEFVPTKLNSSQDYSNESDDDSAGTYDGYVFWSPVDAIDADVSPYSVKGMAGNVSEWSSSWTDHLEFPDRRVPVKRGGSFATQTGYELARRHPAGSPEERTITLGFRTASSTRPEELEPK